MKRFLDANDYIDAKKRILTKEKDKKAKKKKISIDAWILREK